MDENQFLSQLLLIPGLIIIGGFAVLITAILRRGKLAELQHRERMAMIERPARLCTRLRLKMAVCKSVA